MKALTKRIYLIGLTVLCSLCLLFGFVFVFSQTTSVKADTATLEAEFTNDGQFTVSMYNNAVPFEYVDGETEGLPAGYDGAVLKITTRSGVAYATLDFSASQILAVDVESIVVRMYSPNFTLETDEFRTNVGSDATYQVQYGKSGYDMSSWCDLTLNATSMSTMTDANGYLANIAVGVREREQDTDPSKTIYYYIDSITVNMKVDWESEFTNDGQFTVSQYNQSTYSIDSGATFDIPEGYDGAVMKITTAGGVAYTTLDFSASQILAADVESIVVRMYSPDFTLGTDEFRTYPTQVQYGTSGYDMSVSWCDITLNQTTMADMTDENGYLSTISVGVREKDTSKTIYYYIDSITVKLATYGTPTFSAATAGMVGAWDWNHQTENTAVVKDTNYGYTIVADWSMTANATNLAASENLTSRSITLNGTPFYELYQADDGYRLNAQLGYFAFSVPTAALVASNGYAYPTIEIAEGTPFYSGNYLPETTLIYKDGAWQLGEKIEALEKAVFIGTWGSIGIYNSSEQVLLQYSSESDWDYTNEGDLATKITYRNSETNASYSATESNIVGWDGQKWIVLSGMTGYDVIEIAEGGTFGGVEIPALTLYNVNGCWVTTAPQNATTAYVGIADGWNNNVVDALSNNILKYDVNPLGNATDATNLAATMNRTSLMVKYNGKTFCELYADTNNANRTKYCISYAHGNKYFYFAIPEADLVEDAIFEIEEGTPFANQSLGAVKLFYNGSEWEVYVETNYNPDYVSIGTLNHYDNGDMGFGLSLKYDTNGFTTDGNQVMAASYTGVTVNGEAQSVALWGGDQLLFWIAKDKCEAGYNGYSHATLVIEEGAKIVNDSGEEFTLGAATLYLVDGAWTTEKPADYEIKEEEIVIPDLGTPNCLFNGIGIWNNENGTSTLLEFCDFVNLPTVEESFKKTTGYYITLNGVRLSESPNANVYTWGGTYWMHLQISNPAEGSVLIIEEGTPFAGNYLPKIVLKFIDGLWREAFTVRITIDDEVFTVYSQNDVPVVLDDAYFESLLAERSVPGKAVNFSARGVTYAAGTVFKALTDTDVTVQTIGFSTTDGASIRLKTPTGIRYETKIDKADYDALIARYGEANVETGTYILPISLMDTDFRTYFADSAKMDDIDYVKIVNEGFANKETWDTDGYYLYYGSLVNLQPHNYCTDFFGIGYIKITDGENVYTVYGGYDVESYTRSIYYVSAYAYNDYEDGSEQKSVLKSYMDSVVYIADDAVISNVVNIAGYTSPYSISYDSQTGVYTVIGDAEIKSVMIGEKKKFNARTSTLQVGGVEYYITEYSLTASAESSTLTFKLSSIVDPLTLVDFALEVPSNRGVKILQITDTELMDATQMRSADSLSATEQEEYARKNVYANCFNYITQLVEQDRPDLIILTGDSVNGLFDDNGTMWLRFIEFMDSLDTPWSLVFGTLEAESAMGSVWQRAQLANATNCLFKDAVGYTIGITDNGVIRRTIFLFNSDVSAEQTAWMKDVAADVETQYGDIPALAFYSKASDVSFAADFAAANVDGVFMGNSHNDNSTTLVDGISYTYGTKTGTYGEHDENILGGTYITVSANGLEFAVAVEYLDKTEMKNKKFIDLVETYDGSSVVDDAYLAPIWNTDRIYDETGVFVGETGSVTLMYTPTDPKEVVIRDITLGVTYTYGVDYTISSNKVTRVAGGSLPYLAYDEYYRETPVRVNGIEQGWRVDTVEDDYHYSGTRYMNYAEAYNGVARYVTFTYDKTEAWTGTTLQGDANAQSFIEKLKTDKEGTILFYGDSITVGCNASGTSYGGNRNPFLPAWDDLVVTSLEKLYGANITKYNAAVGGWTTAQGAQNLSSQANSVGASLAEVDLFVIAFGMNDPVTSQEDYVASIQQMIDAYYAENPNGSVLLVSPMLPNTQSNMICGNQVLWESALNSVKNSAEYSDKNISLAKVYTMFSELVSVSGKLPRDYLGNNVNHPTDFGVRIYAQVILKTLCGDNFYS